MFRQGVLNIGCFRQGVLNIGSLIHGLLNIGCLIHSIFIKCLTKGVLKINFLIEIVIPGRLKHLFNSKRCNRSYQICLTRIPTGSYLYLIAW